MGVAADPNLRFAFLYSKNNDFFYKIAHKLYFLTALCDIK